MDQSRESGQLRRVRSRPAQAFGAGPPRRLGSRVLPGRGM